MLFFLFFNPLSLCFEPKSSILVLMVDKSRTFIVIGESYPASLYTNSTACSKKRTTKQK